jgi:hypothetical protein
MSPSRKMMKYSILYNFHQNEAQKMSSNMKLYLSQARIRIKYKEILTKVDTITQRLFRKVYEVHNLIIRLSP